MCNYTEIALEVYPSKSHEIHRSIDSQEKKTFQHWIRTFCLQFVALGSKGTRQAQIYGGEHGSLGKDET